MRWIEEHIDFHVHCAVPILHSYGLKRKRKKEKKKANNKVITLTLLATVKLPRGSLIKSCLCVEMLDNEKIGRPCSSTAKPTIAEAGYPAKGDDACEFVPNTPSPCE